MVKIFFELKQPANSFNCCSLSSPHDFLLSLSLVLFLIRIKRSGVNDAEGCLNRRTKDASTLFFFLFVQFALVDGIWFNNTRIYGVAVERIRVAFSTVLNKQSICTSQLLVDSVMISVFGKGMKFIVFEGLRIIHTSFNGVESVQSNFTLVC